MEKYNIRLQVLNERLEKLIELNQIHHYTGSFTPERKIKQYYSLLLRIRAEKQAIYIERRDKNKVYAGQLEVAKNNMTSLTREHLFNLTSPV